MRIIWVLSTLIKTFRINALNFDLIKKKFFLIDLRVSPEDLEENSIRNYRYLNSDYEV